jgi:methyl-accepting chemotaxis protein
MSFFGNLRIAHKLMISFAAIISILGVTSTIVYQNLGLIQQSAGWTTHTYLVLETLDAALGGMVNQETGLRGYLISAEDKFLEPQRAGESAYTVAFQKVKQLTLDNPAQQARLDAMNQLATTWMETIARKEIALMARPDTREQARALESSGAGKLSMDGFRAKIAEIGGIERDLLAKRAEAQTAAFSASYMATILGGIGSFAVALLAGVVLTRGISGPIRAMCGVMTKLAQSDTTVTVPATGRKDEVGEIARAVEVFKQNAVERMRLEDLHTTEQEQAEREKAAALVNMAQKIETESGAAVDAVVKRSEAMALTAEEMSASAERTGESVEAAAAAAVQALANVQTVASASEELAASIREIGSQVNQSTSVVGSAVAAGNDARSRMEALNEQVGRISVVANMISEIAGRTNLLALNATIEAARAGDAGKGFAVVASEVKQLATQTARSTEEITRHIGEVLTATSASVAAVGRIEQTIGEMNAISGSIAAAVEQQSAATAEIARNVNETAAATNEMSRRIGEVSIEAKQTGQRSSQVRDDTASLSTMVGQLREAVIRVVRTSTDEVDRREHARYEVNLKCRLSVAGRDPCDAVVGNISQAGAAIGGVPPLSIGSRGTLQVDRVGMRLPFTVRQCRGEMTILHFDLEAAETARLGQILAGQFGSQRAA